MKTVTEVKIDKTLVEIKSKRDKDAPSGWSIIAFTPSCSIRCTRAHDDVWFSNFACAIIAAAGVEGIEDDEMGDCYDDVCEAIKSIIDIT
ncbi:MAG: hypothetical protein CL438_09455 [Acidimicrobiaceae bacterium]|nr:hypothetical protein [Acidimicrobiaceae bacterium]